MSNPMPTNKQIEDIMQPIRNYADIVEIDKAVQALSELLVRERIEENTLWKIVAEEIVAKDGVYRAVNYLNQLSQEFHDQLTPESKEGQI